MNGNITAENLAYRVAQEIGVLNFIERWNTGEGSLISDLGDLDMAFSFEKTIDRVWGTALLEAQIHGIQDEFHAAFGALVQPVIAETFSTGLKNLCDLWAQSIVDASPAQQGISAPFDDTSEWISWCIANMERPAFARPWGEDLLPEEREEQLLRHALMQKRELAVEHGWISSSSQSKLRASHH